MKVIPETRRAHLILYLRFYDNNGVTCLMNCSSLFVVEDGMAKMSGMTFYLSIS